MKNIIKVSIIYPVEPSYIMGLLSGLSKISGIRIDFLGSDRSTSLFNRYSNINFINIRGSQDDKSSFLEKLRRILKFYFRLIKYCFTTDSQIYHSHFPNKFLFIDYLIINIILRFRGKKIIHTAHNVDFSRDNNHNYYKKMILKIHYRLVDAIIVHNYFSSRILNSKFPVTCNKTFIVKIGMNILAKKSSLTSLEARKILGIPPSSKTILFFGGINKYKGIEYLIEAFSELIKTDNNYFLILAGPPRDNIYTEEILKKINTLGIKNYCINHLKFIPDDDVETYFSASDCCVLPYKYIFQSGVHLLSYSFGIPVIASDVGSFKEEDVIEGETGFIFEASNTYELKDTLLKYFHSNLYKNLQYNREKIKNWASENYSWDLIANNTFSIYQKLVSN